MHCITAVSTLGPRIEYCYLYQDIELNSTYCSSQSGYNCSLAIVDIGVTSDMTPDDVVDSTITIIWDAVEISSGAFRQDRNNGDHVIECSAMSGTDISVSTVTIKGTIPVLHYISLIVCL